MSYDASRHQSHQFEHIIATIFTCRSVVKYNLTLSEAQKGELLDDIDTALEALRTQLITNTSPEIENVVVPKVQSKGILVPITGTEPVAQQKEISSVDQTLQALYRMYHVYLDTQQATNIGTFVNRFNDIMTIINNLQRLIETSYGSYEAFVHQISPDDPLQRVRVFIADLYYIFMEFVRLLSEVLQQNNVHLDTEKLSSMQGEADVQLLNPYREIFEDESMEEQHNFTPLAQVYASHQQLDKVKKHLTSRVADSTAFLEFLKENIGTGTSKGDEIAIQLTNVTQLLVDMQRLLFDYERAASFLLYPHR
ncbi:hypothetical protein [Dictyobacter kobayashii]|uniref:Uncharacterized protein n=1 Tax=Dictyobacter kobayashii TaxID=2014872 RepID=A0A402ALI9_9CHLR|nr:hypothetical protein [Dictyobacter kobayashii]GCE19973.1 hypothetical protein KDK_37730 [Dictyobacter kobayashii]